MSNRPYADPFNERNPINHAEVPPQRIPLSEEQFSPSFPSSSSVNLNGGQATPYDYPPSSFSHSNLGAYPPSNPDEDSEAKMPLTADNRIQTYAPAGFDPRTYGDPYNSPYEEPATNAMSAEADWRRRQTIKRDRAKTVKVKLTKGHFIHEFPVPTAVKNALEPVYRDFTHTREFSHLRYTAATCDPDDFTTENGWSLRASNYGRHTELLIVITSYNEDKILYARSLHAVMLNVRDICKTRQSKYWRSAGLEGGQPGWQRIVVALITDGLEPMDKTVLDLLATIGVYQDGVMKKEIDDKQTEAHIFEYTTQLSVDTTPQLIVPHGDDPNNLVPVQIILVAKAKNQKKINSHRWLFNAIGRMLQPEVCILLDAGTKPYKKSLYYIWEAFYNNKNLGGACGEIYAQLKGGKKLINPLVAAQNFEYKISNILDKPLESAFGYVSVLPGAFSAYRYRAIQDRPLEQYFHGDHSMAERLGNKGINGMNIFTKNMFLAEDRILCFELVAKENARWTLSYVKSSKAETDVPEEGPELISQRRRWLNGSFAASVYAIANFFRLYRSSHGIVRMFFLHVQLIFNTINLMFSWFSISCLWLTFSIVITLLSKQGTGDTPIYSFGTPVVTYWFNRSFQWIWAFIVICQFVLALGNKPKAERTFYNISFFVFGILGLYLIYSAIFLTVKAFINMKVEGTNAWERLAYVLESENSVLIAALAATFGIYFLASFLFLDPWHMFTSFPQYLLMAPSFINVLNVYAFCNLHDVSWGTKGSDKDDALPAVKSKKEKGGEATAETNVMKQKDIDGAFQETVKRTVATKIKEKSEPEKPSSDDENKAFRSRLVLFWLLCNMIVVIVVQSADGLSPTVPQLSASDAEREQFIKDSRGYSQWLTHKQSMFFKVILWTTFGITAFKFVGALYFWIKTNAFRCCRKN
ncbi:hypothetical protein E3P92_02229 [Wallemia ichthyophaga]|uniref:Chitin synthase n=2 Tax=Wallemia ichthyophaga TaxID=245174 RepID=A0A4T0GBM9_WALIC|nr:Chitin synthase 1 [Wallemia ichthyophaga EXF-994]TIA72519.1 hypothetical protein E3P91_01980 [Wallemia ichthyophaga]EOR03651.1 Chitin synthase 1 [Wallemia ichthyophaga EXF-994]TIA97526.1 hypothetical protein E3P95_02825 [Wallemia ichthyophaga]TIA98644.1 hypothetical protein E3P94_02877 [Wallemia ichthyophaga]TIB04487.1 hypothetical protein E3P96_01606 [Wallemia ichthyophaga]